jgi:hypothetical protein
MNNINLSYLFVILIMIMPYAGQGGIAYAMAALTIFLRIATIRNLNRQFLFFSTLAIGVYLFKSFSPNADLLIRYWQVYFGFLIFYLLFYSSSNTVSIENVAILISMTVIIEALLINTIMPVSLMLNMPTHDGILIEGHYTNYFGFYQRPYGPGTNPSMTSTLLVVLYTLIKRKSVKWLVFSAVTLSASTTGYVLLLIAYFILNPVNFRGLSYLIMIGLLAFILSALDDYFLYRISPAYLMTIAEYTLDQYLSHLKPDNYSLLIGTNYLVDGEPFYQSDNGWAPFFYTNGLIILIAYLLTPFWKGSYQKKAPYIIFLLGAIHYPAIFSLPGQVIFALLLSNRIRPNETLIWTSPRKQVLAI